MKRVSIFTIVVCCIAMYSGTAQAQSLMSSDARGLSSSATETITVKPAKIRLLMWIKAQGKDAKSAILALNGHKEKVRKELASMKAEADSVAFSPSRIGSGNSNQEQRMIQMQMRAMRGGGNATPTPAPKIVTATCALKAEWALPVQEGDALAILPATLKEQIGARDLAGDKNKPELSESEQEQMDEMQKMMEEQMGGYYSSEDEGNGPTIKFVGTAEPADISAATKKAFESAVAKAKTVSESTGVKLAKLSTVATQSNNAFEDMRRFSSYSNYENQMPAMFENGSENEVSSDSASDLKYSVIIGLVYDIE